MSLSRQSIGIVQSDGLQILQAVDLVRDILRTGYLSFLNDIEPRQWQREALVGWERECRGIARVVTGGGKTVFSYLCIESFLGSYPEGQITIVVPTVALMDQWFVDIVDATRLVESDIACYSGGGRSEESRKVNLLVLNTARVAAPKISEDQSIPRLLIVDECHRAGSPENAKALDGNYVATLGLSATPERENDDGFEERIVPALGPVFFDYDYRDASRDGVIVDFDLINVEIDAHNSESLLDSISRQEQLAENHSIEITDGLRRSISRKAARATATAMRVPWAIRLALMHANERIIIFHERIHSLQLIVDVLGKVGRNALAYHSNLSAAHRRDNLRLFRRGEIDTLVTCRALDEGANVPEANVAIVARSTSSTRQRIQRLGRVLRPGKGKSHAIVYTLYDGDDEKKRLAAEASGLVGVANSYWKTGVAK